MASFRTSISICSIKLLILTGLLWYCESTENITQTNVTAVNVSSQAAIGSFNATFLPNITYDREVITTFEYVLKPSSPWKHIGDYFTDFKSQVVALNSEFCGFTCNFRYVLRLPRENFYCDQCDCKEACMEIGCSCPSVVLLQSPLTGNSVVSGCVESELPVTNDTIFYQMITWCPDSYNVSSVKEKCENSSYTSWANVVPHLNSDTGISYRNIYCATCHGQNSTRTWMTSITCSSFDRSLESASLSETFTAVMKSKVCNIQLVPPLEAVRRRCQQRENPLIVRCNETGLWRSYDKNVDVACSMFSQVVFGAYRNVFCYFCNSDVNWEAMKTKLNENLDEFSYAGESRDFFTVPLTALINLDSNLMKSEDSYSDSAERYQNLSLSCAEGKRLNNNECRSLFPSSNIYGYRVCFQINVTFQTPLKPSQSLKRIIYRHMPITKMWVSSNITGYIVQLQNCPNKTMFVVIRYVLKVFSLGNNNRDEFEEKLMGNELIDWAMFYDRFHNRCSQTQTMVLKNGSVEDCSNLFSEFVATQTTNDEFLGDKYLQLSKQLICPRVRLAQSEYKIRYHDDVSIHSLQDKTLQFPTLTFLSTGTVLNHQDFQILDDGSIVVCLEDYVNATFHAKYSNKHKLQKAQQNILGIFSFVCSSISLLFLALTFITYCLFPSMRTVGGVCNMGLIATVFAAQAVFEYGIEQNEDAIGCQVIGIIIHFLWLAAVFWMNACTFVLFLRLSFPLKCRNFDQSLRKIVLLSALYSYGVSALIVTLNIITNFALHSQIGYGGIICYLNNSSSKTYFFKVPVGVIVLVNIGLFVFTLCNLRRHGLVNSTRESKINMFACFKLSATTGLFWLFSYLYEVFQIEVFAYVFTIFVGLQGVLFFVAIVVNRNVLSLWSRRLRDKKDHVHANSTTSTERLTNSSKHFHDYELKGNPVDDKQ